MRSFSVTANVHSVLLDLLNVSPTARVAAVPSRLVDLWKVGGVNPFQVRSRPRVEPDSITEEPWQFVAVAFRNDTNDNDRSTRWCDALHRVRHAHMTGGLQMGLLRDSTDAPARFARSAVFEPLRVAKYAWSLNMSTERARFGDSVFLLGHLNPPGWYACPEGSIPDPSSYARFERHADPVTCNACRKEVRAFFNAYSAYVCLACMPAFLKDMARMTYEFQAVCDAADTAAARQADTGDSDGLPAPYTRPPGCSYSPRGSAACAGVLRVPR